MGRTHGHRFPYAPDGASPLRHAASEAERTRLELGVAPERGDKFRASADFGAP
jgi:hypothetical protein